MYVIRTVPEASFNDYIHQISLLEVMCHTKLRVAMQVCSNRGEDDKEYY